MLVTREFNDLLAQKQTSTAKDKFSQAKKFFHHKDDFKQFLFYYNALSNSKIDIFLCADIVAMISMYSVGLLQKCVVCNLNEVLILRSKNLRKKLDTFKWNTSNTPYRSGNTIHQSKKKKMRTRNGNNNNEAQNNNQNKYENSNLHQRKEYVCCKCQEHYNKKLGSIWNCIDYEVKLAKMEIFCCQQCKYYWPSAIKNSQFNYGIITKNKFKCKICMLKFGNLCDGCVDTHLNHDCDHINNDNVNNGKNDSNDKKVNGKTGNHNVDINVNIINQQTERRYKDMICNIENGAQVCRQCKQLKCEAFYYVRCRICCQGLIYTIQSDTCGDCVSNCQDLSLFKQFRCSFCRRFTCDECNTCDIRGADSRRYCCSCTADAYDECLRRRA